MIKIFAFPGAGSSAITYYKWMRFLPESFLISPIDLPGRGMKSKEEKILKNDELIDYFFTEIHKKLNGTDDEYVLIGNSFSSILTIQLCNKIEKENRIQNPKHVFLSVEPPPIILKTRKKISEDISRKQFIKDVINKFFENSIISYENRELILEFILEKLYNDKKKFLSIDALEIYQTVFGSNSDINSNILELINFIIEHLQLFLEDEDIIDKAHKENLAISTDITVFGVIGDIVASENDLKKWSEYTRGIFRLEMLQGNHTILYDNPELIIRKMKEVL